MPILPAIDARAPALRAIYRDLHAHPEIGFQETRTAAIVAERLRAWGVDEVHVGIGGTGVVGLIKGKGGGNRRIGLRADMDALPVQEATGLPHASQNPGTMHACGHDAHTTMLLGAAEYLAATRDFDGTVVLIFQPAEEGLGGARAMLAEGLFERFPCDELYALHNVPTGKPNRFSLYRGTAMAGASFFDIVLNGQGSHAAMPEQSRDVIVAATALVGQLQTVVSRNLSANKALVLSVTQIHAGAAYNVIPATATLAGTLRFFDAAVRDMAQARMRAICDGFALAHGIAIEVTFREIFNPLVNDDAACDALTAAARDVVGDALLAEEPEPATGSEDFADMLRQVPGCYGWLGHAGTAALHSPQFVLDEGILPVGASIFARVVEQRLPLAAG
jgi:hippurate hydrolase